VNFFFFFYQEKQNNYTVLCTASRLLQKCVRAPAARWVCNPLFNRSLMAKKTIS